MAQFITFVFCWCLLLEICLPAPSDYDKKANEEGNLMITEVNKGGHKLLNTDSKAKELLQKLQKNLSTFDSNTALEEVRHVKKQFTNVLKNDTSTHSKEKSAKLGQLSTMSPEKSVRNVEATLPGLKISTVKPIIKDIVSPKKVNTKFLGKDHFDPEISDEHGNVIQRVTFNQSKTTSTTSSKVIEQTTLAAEKIADIVENVGLMPGPVIIDPYDKTAEDDLFWDENLKSASKDTNNQLHDDYEREDDDWYEDTNTLESEDKEDNSDEDTDDWNFWNDHHEVVTDKYVNVADKFGDFWDEESYAQAPYLKENTVTSRWNRNDRGNIRREINMMTLYCWVLFISMTMLILYVFYKQKNVFKPYWMYLYRRPAERRLSSEDAAEERKGIVNHAFA
ncbi:uncharacterized protein LOC133204409 [Saccostrea echinata]|uniref:uncharacterized protein LOC133204409 n=1 Tax=Saccostrea echinata TaxID=191078 RepID=UPI002A818DE5|nr:uncharacterized protein LOC133204409 [Saccostrea echinata]